MIKTLKRKFFYLSFVFLGITASCSNRTPIYLPNAIQTTVFNHKKELHFGGTIGISGTDLQSAYSLTNNFGIFGDYSFSNAKANSVAENGEGHSHFFAEGGISYYHTSDEFPGIFFGMDRLFDTFSFETFVGFGHGISKGDVDNVFKDTSNVFTSSDFNKYSIQLNLASLDQDNAITSMFAITFKLAAVDHYNFKSEIANVNRHFTNIYFGYGGFNKIGFKNFKLELQLMIYTTFSKELDAKYVPFNLSVGFHFNFDL